MGAHIDGPIQVAIMKTTIEISDRLLREARDLAASEGITLRVVVERGLRRVVEKRRAAGPSSFATADSLEMAFSRNSKERPGTSSWRRSMKAVAADSG
jgi:hypothetical protein